ncbi:type VI secretion system secreted protein VgrG [Pseudoduganella lurida]|uniref:Type VI secretion system secreted protein VgrG n=1 Tax=Pseudoduganella lurida TaxID=1036180 RepID=A0A562REM8_9BURK|nr:type VI secretion system tip protein TssI/VgrG [Pseudoduganella lurida]TWI67529.1 type VI secretion system secreted protein VgrG [Pseudoduganella lurida]
MNQLNDAFACLSALTAASQHDRLLKLDFPRNDGPNAMMLANAFDGDEALSRDFRYTVEVLSDDANLSLAEAMGKMVTVSLVRDDGSLRYFNGYVFEFRFLRTDGGFAFYEMVLRPWLAFLELRHDCATFQGMTLTELSTRTFDAYLSRDYRLHLSGQETDITLAIQYNESDANHLQRRWESAGLHYWYEHRYDGHTLVLSDDSTLADPIDGDAIIDYQSEAGTQEADAIQAWSAGRQLTSALYTVRTYEFKNARADWADQSSLSQAGAVPALEHHEYTGAHGFTSATGPALAKLRMEQADSAAHQFRVESNHRAVQPGRTFALAGHFSLTGSNADSYLVISVHHQATNNYQADRQISSRYTNSFTCLRSAVHWRPERGHNSRDTRIYGVQTATVVGPKGEEIYTDEYGRVRVQFHWDRAGEFDEKSSPWVRVMSTWAGANFGHISLPRIGQEVVVQFLEGHCDRPLIIGSVYNAANMPPWDLPANRSQSGVLSRSTLNATAANANALRFEDKKGAEEIWLHAERNQRIEVEQDESHSVGQDRHKTIGRDEVVEVKRDRTETVDGHEKITVHASRNERVDKSETIDIGGPRSETVGENEDVSIAGEKSERVGRNKVETIAIAKMLNVGAAYSVNVGAAMNTLVGQSQFAEIGNSKTTVVGTNYVIEAGTSLLISVGASSLMMDQSGTITMSGTNISINSSGPVQINGKDVDIN